MTRINNPQHSSFISATNTPGASRTQETARSLPIPASALNILNRGAARTATDQTGFDAPVSAQRAQFNLTGEFETPAPRPRTATAAPASGPAPALPQSELQRALNEAHRMVYGNDANGAGVENWLAQARKLANENGNDFNAVKFALHAELMNAKKGAPLSEGSGPLPGSEVNRALQEAQQMIGGAPAGKDWAARARELAAQPGAKFNDVKFALHGEMLAAQSGRPTTPGGSGPLPGSEVNRALQEAQQMIGGAPAGKDWAARAKELAALHGNDFNAVKFALHGEMLAAKSGRTVTPPGAPLPESELKRALNEAHRMVYGNDANGAGVENWMAQARKLAKENGNDFEAVKFALHTELMNAKKGAPLSEGSGPLPGSEVNRALQEAQQMIGGAPAGKDWAARARELAAQPGAKFNDVKFALHGEMLAAKSGRPTLREGQALPPSELQRALNEAHQMVFGGNVSGRNLGAWTARAQELAALHGNDFNAVKFALHKEMMELK